MIIHMNMFPKAGLKIKQMEIPLTSSIDANYAGIAARTPQVALSMVKSKHFCTQRVYSDSTQTSIFMAQVTNRKPSHSGDLGTT